MTEILGMKALSIHQPYAGLIAAGAKTIETRSYATKHRGPIVICSTQRLHPDAYMGQSFGDGLELGEGWRRLADGSLSIEPALSLHKDGERFLVKLLRHGVALGVADLVDCLPIVAETMHCNGEQRIFNYGDGELWRTRPSGSLGGPPRISDQLPRGDFTPGNYGWMLENFKPFDEPIPVKGQQQIWTVKPNNLSGEA